ncbi:MAG: hypothetical protein K0U84_06570 [Actinomycetia bacterium]|nr:hypothetical protein [Actinomycetes bacterium]
MTSEHDRWRVANPDDPESTVVAPRPPSGARSVTPPPMAPPPQWQAGPPQPPRSGPQPYPGTPVGPPPGPVPPQGPPPGPGAGFGPAPAGHGRHPGYGVGPNGQPTPPSMPPPPRDYRADVRAALNKGNSWLGRLLRKGVNGELIPVPAFQSYRMHKPVPLIVAVYITGLVLAVVFNRSAGLIGMALGEAMWALTAFVLIAIGTKGALQTVVYGIGLLGALDFASLAYVSFTSYSIVSSSPYGGSASGLSLGMLVIGFIAVVLAVVHSYIGIQVHREIRKIASGQ